MNEEIKEWQRIIGADQDGVFGPDTLRRSKALIPAIPALDELPWITAMKSVYGLHEVRDKARLQLWLKSDGKTLGDPSALPWCGDAVETAIKTALPKEPFVGAVGANPYYARNWAGFGRAGMGFGSIGVFERGPDSGHVGFIVGHDVSCYHVLGGNQGDSVSVVRMDKLRLLAARWPMTWAWDPMPLVIKSSANIPHSVNEF